MLRQVIKKIKNKKWLSFCLVLGLTFFVATMSCHPMFKAGALDKLIYRLFVQHIESENTFPTVIGKDHYVASEKCSTVEQLEAEMEKYKTQWENSISLPILQEQLFFTFTNHLALGSYKEKENSFHILYMPEFDEHTEIIYGQGLDESQDDIPSCVVSEYVMDKYQLIVGEVIEFSKWETADGTKVRLRVSGVFKEKTSDDLFWQVEPAELASHLFVSEETFDSLLAEGFEEFIFYTYYRMPDYRAINHKNMESIAEGIADLEQKDEKFLQTLTPFIEEFRAGKKTVDVTLWVLELPILGMIFAYIYMVACQIVDTEKNEIAMMKSRGGSRFQVVQIYILQCVILAAVALVIGLPMGIILCKIGAATTNFLTFSAKGLSIYRPVWEMLIYSIVAIVVSIVFLLIPIVAASGVSIVQRIGSVKINKKPVWEKYYFDLILLAVSVYLIYNFNRNLDNIRQTAMEGQRIDPVLFFDSVLFIFSFGLLVLRLIQYMVKLIYRIGKSKWKPAMYASFLQITRTFGKQSGISIFLILTIALGLFYANVARTINSNSVDRIAYNTGAEVVVSEQWEKKLYQVMGRVVDYEYVEPDYLKYDALQENGMCESITRVVRDDAFEVSYNKTVIKDCQMQGIITDEYGRTSSLKEELHGQKHWYHYLNMLAEEPNGIIISSNLADALGVEQGQRIHLNKYGDIKVLEDKQRGTMAGNVCAVVDHWPGYQKYVYENGERIEKYLVVINYASVYSHFKVMPYEVWMKPAAGISAEDIEGIVEGMKMENPTVVSVEKQVSDMNESTMIQITNGMFTLGFLISLILCFAGFMIYWIASVRQRELLFGIYRAMGMTVTDVNRMLINEHIFSTLFSVVAGAGVGVVATVLFAELFAVVYLPQEHNVPIFLSYDAGDILKLAVVIVFMMITCMLVLRKLIRSMNITQALKLGED